METYNKCIIFPLIIVGGSLLKFEVISDSDKYSITFGIVVFFLPLPSVSFEMAAAAVPQS